MRQETYYQVLQVDPEATQAVIEAAFRRLARKYHPDICTEQDNPEKMKEITAAYSVLRHQMTRVTYDKELAHVSQNDAPTESQTLARVGILGSIIILFAVLILSAFQGRSPAIALGGSRAAEMQSIAATDTANAILIRNAIVATLTALPTTQAPLALHATPVPNSASNNTPATGGSIAQASGNVATQLLEQPAMDTSDSGTSDGGAPSGKAVSEDVQNEQPPIDVSAVGDEGQAALSVIAAVNGLVESASSTDHAPLLEADLLETDLSTADDTAAIQPVDRLVTEPTAEPTLEPTVVPTVEPISAPTATSFAEAVIPALPQPTATDAEIAIEPRVSIVEPRNNVESGGLEIFAWDRSFALEESQAVELVFWKPGQDPIQHGFGLAPPTHNNVIAVNLDALDETLGPLLDPGTYQWGLLLVEMNPYRRLNFAGGGNDFRFANFGTIGSNGSSRKAKSGE